MVHFMYYLQTGTTHGNLDDFLCLNITSKRRCNCTGLLSYIFCGGLNMSNVELVI